MRNHADVNAHRTAYRQHARSNGANIRMPRLLEAPEVRTPEYLVPSWRDLFLPHKETRLLTEEAQRTGGVFMPWPLLGIIMTLVLALGGGIIGLYSQLSAMNATMIMRDADQRETIKELKNKLELQEMYTKDIREKMVELRTELNQLERRRGGS